MLEVHVTLLRPINPSSNGLELVILNTFNVPLPTCWSTVSWMSCISRWLYSHLFQSWMESNWIIIDVLALCLILCCIPSKWLTLGLLVNLFPQTHAHGSVTALCLFVAYWWCPVAFPLQVHFSGQICESFKTTGQRFYRGLLKKKKMNLLTTWHGIHFRTRSIRVRWPSVLCIFDWFAFKRCCFDYFVLIL